MLLVTGSTGFVGSHFIDNLDCDYRVLVRSKPRRIDEGKFFILDDLDELSYKHPCFEGVDCIVHLAGCAHQVFTDEEYEVSNVYFTKRLSEQASLAGVKRFIFISTALVHGDRTDSAKIDVNSKVCPSSKAAQSKLAAENQLISVCNSSDMEYVIIRSPLIYGYGVKANFGILQRLVSLSIPLPTRALSTNLLSLVSVYNLIDFINVCTRHPNAVNQIFLVSDDNDLSTSDIVSFISQSYGKLNLSFPMPLLSLRMLAVVFNRKTAVDRLTVSLQLDISHSKDTLSWTPVYSVQQGFALSANRQ